MTILNPVIDHSQDIAAAMAAPALARLHIGGAPVVLATGTPAKVIYASSSAQRLFGTGSLDMLTIRLFGSGEPGSQRLKLLENGAALAARLERLRFSLHGLGEVLTVQCSTMEAVSGARLFVVAALGVRPALLRAPVPEPAKVIADAARPPATPELSTQGALSLPVAEFAALPPADGAADNPAIPATAPGAPSLIAPPSQWEAACKLGRPVRFSWRSDVHGHLTDFPEILADIASISHASILAQPWPDLIKRLALDPAGELARALAGRATFSAVETFWPVAGGLEQVPVVFGATPVTGADHSFAFYRGFGLLHPARRAEIADPPAVKEQAQPVVQVPELPEEKALPTALHARPELTEVAPPARAMHEAATGLALPQAAEVHLPEGQSAPLPALQAVLPAESIGEPLAGATPVLLAEISHVPEPPFHTPANSNQHLAVPHGLEAVTPGAELPRRLLEEAGEEADTEIAEAPMADEDAKIIRLRPLQGHLKLAAQTDKLVFEKIAPAPPGADPYHPALRPVPPTQGLTNSERQAFSEIARSLTAKIKDSAPEMLKPAANAPVAEAFSTADQPILPMMALSAPPLDPDQGILQPVVVPATAEAVSGNTDANLTDLLQRLPLGVLVCREGHTLYVNTHLVDLLGYADADAFKAGKGLDRMFRGRAPEAMEPALEAGNVPLVAQNGDILMAEARLQAVEWDGAAASLLTLRRAPEQEIHARVQALELDVRQHEAEARELHAILDTATDGVAILDENGLILSLNRSAEALFGYDQNEVAGETFTTLVAADQVHLAQDYFHGIKTNGVASVLNDGREMLGRARQGGAIPLFMTLGRVGPGTNPKYCAILRDLTQWKKVEGELGDARREAERASQLKSDFLAKISHEIRTPLNAILGFAEVMSEERFGAIGNERYKEYLKDIHTSGEHVMSLVNDLLDLSKIEAGKMELEFSSVDANKIVAECVAMMQPQAASARIIMRQSLAPRLPNIVADERALRQIVLNLLSNAVKFNEAGGQVIVSTALTDAGHAVIRIRDTGIGMTDSDVLAAMEPFKQLQTSRKQSGTGLGLPLTKALVEANRAGFSIKSKKAEGTLVEVAFPPTRVLAE